RYSRIYHQLHFTMNRNPREGPHYTSIGSNGYRDTGLAHFLKIPLDSGKLVPYVVLPCNLQKFVQWSTGGQRVQSLSGYRFLNEILINKISQRVLIESIVINRKGGQIECLCARCQPEIMIIDGSRHGGMSENVDTVG